MELKKGAPTEILVLKITPENLIGSNEYSQRHQRIYLGFT